MIKPNIGDQFFRVQFHTNYCSGSDPVGQLVSVTKVGRKYFYLGEGLQESKHCISDLSDPEEFSEYKLFKDEASFGKWGLENKMWRDLCDFFNYSTSTKMRGDSLRKIYGEVQTYKESNK